MRLASSQRAGSKAKTGGNLVPVDACPTANSFLHDYVKRKGGSSEGREEGHLGEGLEPGMEKVFHRPRRWCESLHHEEWG